MSFLKIFFICQIVLLLGNVLCFHLIESDLHKNSFVGPQNVKILKNETHLQTSTAADRHKPIQQDAAVKDRPQNETFLGDDVETNQSHRHRHRHRHHHLPTTTQPQYQLKYENNFEKHDANTATKLLSSTFEQQKHENQNVIETTTTTTATIIQQNGVNQPHNLEKHQKLTVNQAIIKEKQHQHQYQQLFLSDFKLLNAVNCRNKRQTQQTGYNDGNNNANKNDNNNGNVNGNDNVNVNANANGNQQQLYTMYSIQYYPYHQQQQQPQQQRQSLQYEMQQQHPQYQLQYYHPTSQNLQKNYNNNNPQLIGNGNSLSIHPSSLSSATASAVASIYTSTLALPAINMQHKQQQQQQQSAPQKSLLTLPLPTFLATTTAATTLDSFQPLLPLDIINEYEGDNVDDDSNTFVCEKCCDPMELQPPNCTKCCSPFLNIQTLKTLGG